MSKIFTTRGLKFFTIHYLKDVDTVLAENDRGTIGWENKKTGNIDKIIYEKRVRGEWIFIKIETGKGSFDRYFHRTHTKAELKEAIKDMAFQNGIKGEGDIELVDLDISEKNIVDSLMALLIELDSSLNEPTKIVRYTPNAMYSSLDGPVWELSNPNSWESYVEIIWENSSLTLWTYVSFSIDPNSQIVVDQRKKEQIDDLLANISYQLTKESQYYQTILKNYM